MLNSPPPDSDAAEPVEHTAAGEAPAAAVRIGSPGGAAAERVIATLPPGRFSPGALAELKARIDAYAADLVAEAIRIAEWHQADVVSPAYVRQASAYLVVRTRNRKLALLGSLGAVVLGTAFPSFLEVAWGKDVSVAQVMVSAVLGIAGSLLVALQFVKE
jgi:hypothetical protein